MSRAAGSRGQIAQGAQAAFPDNMPGGFGYRGKYTADAAGFVPNGAVGEREIAFLGISIAFEKKQKVIGPGGFASLQNPFQHGADDVPDLRPAFAAGVAPEPRDAWRR